MENILKVEIRQLNANGSPSDTVVATSEGVSALSINRDAFYTFSFSTPVVLPDVNEKYAIVLTETNSSENSHVGWITSSENNPYIDGVRWKKRNNEWISFAEEDHYFKVHHQAPSKITINENEIVFNKYKTKNTYIDIYNKLHLNTNFMVSFCIDSSGTMKNSDPLNYKAIKTKQFFEQMLLQTTSAYVDVWTFGKSIFQATTNGFTNIPAEYNAAFGTIVSNGLKSHLWTSMERAIGNLESHSLIETIIKNEKIEECILLMSNSNRIDLNEIPTIDPSFNPDDGIEEIINHSRAVDYIIQEYVDSFHKFNITISDGFDNEVPYRALPEDISITANAISGHKKTPVYCFAIGSNYRSDDFLNICNETGGELFLIGNEYERLEESFSMLLNDVDKTIFQGSYEDTIEFNESTYLEAIEIDVIADNDSNVEFNISISYDGVNYQPWKNINLNQKIYINFLIYSFKIKIKLWQGVSSTPIVNHIKYWTISPSIKYGFTKKQYTDSDVAEYILAANQEDDENINLKWAIIRGDSTDWHDGEQIRPNRKGILPDRKNDIYFTPDLEMYGVSTTKADQLGYIYRAIDDSGLPLSWRQNDSIIVYVNNNVINVNSFPYQLDWSNGYIWFSSPLDDSDIVSLDIFRPGFVNFSNGELTTTNDNRLYFAKNGSWPWDADVVVRVNNTIRRDGYMLSPSDGTVFFLKEMNDKDVITLEINHSDSYRISYEMKSYKDDTGVEEHPSFGMIFSTAKTTDSIFIENISESPIAENVMLLPSNQLHLSVSEDDVISTSLSDRLEVTYDFYQEAGNEEHGTTIEWYVKKYGELEYIHYVEYDHRNIMRTSDIPLEDLSYFEEGDSWYVVVTPSDVNGQGVSVRSNIILIGNTVPPYIIEAEFDGVYLPLKNQRDDGEYYYTSPEQDLHAVFTYIDPNVTENDDIGCIVDWYKVEDSTTPLYTGRVIPSSFVTSGSILYYIVTPYDGVNYGEKVASPEIFIGGLDTP